MPCECDNYINCNDPGIEVVTYSNDNAYSHKFSNESLIDNVMVFTHKMTRNFNVAHAWDRSINISHIISGCETKVTCDNHAQATPSCHLGEYCKIEKNVPYYWDEHRGIYVWKSITEIVNIGLSSNKTAAFKTKWGTSYFHKICIPNTTKVSGIEKFVMVKGGIQSVLAEVAYTYNPFPVTDAGGTWGLYGNTVTKVAVPDTANVACILLFPTVPKQAIAQDNDVIHYGFYDYNATDGGFIETRLPEEDGGKDYFYPYWCRQMPFDPLWRQTADQRYNVIYSKGQLDVSGHSVYTPQRPEVYPFPFGSFALNSSSDFIASCVLQFGDRAEGKGVVYNECSVADLIAAIKSAGPSMSGAYSTTFPVSPL